MPEITPQEDLLQDTDLNVTTFRSDLMPGWFKGIMGLILFYNIRELFSIPSLFSQVNEVDETTAVVLGVTYSVYILSSIAMIIVRILLHKQSNLAIKVALPAIIVSLCLSLLAFIGILTGSPDAQPTAHFWLVAYTGMLIASLVHVLRIRNKWAEASKID